MSAGFALLWSKILDSSIWMESKETRLVWITILAMKNVEGRVFAARKALAHRARVSEEECDEALKVLLSPDPQSSTRAEQGRRILEIEGGWQVVNHELYRFSTEAKREFWRQQKADQRKPYSRKKGKPLTGEAEAIRAAERGQDEVADIITKNHEQAIAKKLGRDELREEAPLYMRPPPPPAT